METAITILGPISPALYALAFVLYLVLFVKRNKITAALATPALVLAIAEHAAYSVLRALVHAHHPMASLFEVLSIVALALAIVYLLIETWRKNKATGVFVLPFVVIVQAVSMIGIEPTLEIQPILRDPLFGMHTGTATLGYAGLFLAAVYAVMHLLFHRALRRKNFGLLFERLTSLDVLARMNRGAILVGFAFLSLGLVFGLIWAARVEIPDYWADPKVLLTLAFWAVFGFAILAQYVLRWASSRVAWISLVGFVLMVVSTVVVNVLLSSWHRFGG
ncbi:MAG: cytochrome c biogenesis protein CcsA [Deltaproteobacteria bacterium]|nr:cytochrome c biogenesis protein CcsA [Deltaproteobacteria bacterium]